MLQTVTQASQVHIGMASAVEGALGPFGGAMTVRRLAPHELLCRQGDVADAVYYVMEGALKAYKLTTDGRRQIVGFFGPGDFIGLGWAEECSFSAEVVRSAKVGRIAQSKLDRLTKESPLLACRLLAFARKELAAAQEHHLLLGRMTPLERVATFLLSLAERDRSRRLELPMSRQDIADHLGLTIETVSRCFTKLRKAGVIDLPRAHDVVVQAWDRLSDIAAGEDESFRPAQAA